MVAGKYFMTTVDGMFIWRLYGGGDDWGDSVDQYRWWKLPGQHLHRKKKCKTL